MLESMSVAVAHTALDVSKHVVVYALGTGADEQYSGLEWLQIVDHSIECLYLFPIVGQKTALFIFLLLMY